MNLIRSLILIAFGGLILLLTVRRLSQYKLKERYALIFLFTGLPFLLLAFLPDTIVQLADWLRIEKPTLMLLGVTGFLLLMVLELLTIVSQQDRKITTLAQMVGILMEQKQKPADVTPAPQAPSPGT